jgi:hypothetical protein
MNEEELTNWLNKNKEFNLDDGYEQCPQKIFNEIKEKCIEIWTESGWFENEDYIDEKLQIIESIQNLNANVMFMMHMFHPILRNKIENELSTKAQEYIDRYNKIAYDN